MMQATNYFSREHVATEGIALFRRLSALSEEALCAVEAADAETLIDILEERALIIEAVDTLLKSLPPRSGELRARGMPSGDPTVEFRRKATELEASDARLAIALASRRDQLARELEALDHGETARSAYEPKRRGRDRINVVR